MEKKFSSFITNKVFMRHRFQTRFSKREKYTKRIIARDYIIVFDIPLPRCDVMLDKKKKKNYSATRVLNNCWLTKGK